MNFGLVYVLEMPTGDNGAATKRSFDAFFENIATAAGKSTSEADNSNIVNNNSNSNSHNPWQQQQPVSGSPEKFTADMKPAANSKNPFL